MVAVRRALYHLSKYWGGGSLLDMPATALLTEDGYPIMTEDGQLIEIES